MQMKFMGLFCTIQHCNKPEYIGSIYDSFTHTDVKNKKKNTDILQTSTNNFQLEGCLSEI